MHEGVVGIPFSLASPTLGIPPSHGVKALLGVLLAGVRHHTKGSLSSLWCLVKVLQSETSSHFSVKFGMRAK